MEESVQSGLWGSRTWNMRVIDISLSVEKLSKAANISPWDKIYITWGNVKEVNHLWTGS